MERSSTHRIVAIAGAVALAVSTAALWAAAVPPVPASASLLTPEATAQDEGQEGPVIPDVPPGCADAIVDDDGSVETGYGWVPSSVEGIFLQEYSSDEVPSGALTTVCVCWLHTRMDDTIDFEVAVYGHNFAEGGPQKHPVAVVPAQLADIPIGVPGATFTEVPLGNVPVPEGPFYVGVRWNPSVDQFFFSCVDKTDRPGPPTRVFFRDDTFPAGWGVSDDTNDSTFLNHQAQFVRPVPVPGPPPPEPSDIPLGRGVSWVLAALLLWVGALAVRKI